MIDISKETLISLDDVAKVLPVVGARKPPHKRTIWRWTANGVRGVRLETVCVGGLICTSKEAVGRFLETLSDARASAVTMEGGMRRTVRRRRTRQVEAAMRRLATEHGI